MAGGAVSARVTSLLLSPPSVMETGQGLIRIFGRMIDAGFAGEVLLRVLLRVLMGSNDPRDVTWPLPAP